MQLIDEHTSCTGVMDHDGFVIGWRSGGMWPLGNKSNDCCDSWGCGPSIHGRRPPTQVRDITITRLNQVWADTAYRSEEMEARLREGSSGQKLTGKGFAISGWKSNRFNWLRDISAQLALRRLLHTRPVLSPARNLISPSSCFPSSFS